MLGTAPEGMGTKSGSVGMGEVPLTGVKCAVDPIRCSPLPARAKGAVAIDG